MKNNKCNILNKFLAKSFLKSFALVFFGIAGMICLFAILSNMQSFTNKAKDVPFAVGLELALVHVFHTLNTTLPLSVLLAGILALWRLSRSSELTVIRGAGLSAWNFITPIVATCAAIGILNMAVLNPIGSALLRRSAKLSYKYELTHKNPLLFSQNGLWLKEKSEFTQSFIYSEYIKKEGDTLEGKNLTIFITDLSNHFLKRVEAKSAALKNKVLELEDVVMIDPRLFEEKFDRYEYPTALTIDKIEENSAEPDTFSFWELPGFISFFEESGFSARKYRSYFYTLLFLPITLIAMLFVAAVFSISPKRSQINLLFKLSGGAMCGFGVFFADQIVRAMGTSGRVSLFASSIAMPLTTILVCSTILLVNEDG